MSNQPYTMEMLPGEPILLVTFTDSFSVKEHYDSFLEKLRGTFDEASEPIWMIDHFLDMRLSFSEMVSALGKTTKGSLNVFRHPNFRKLAVISKNDLLVLSSKAMKQVQYGGIEVDLYPTLEEALAGIREDIANA